MHYFYHFPIVCFPHPSLSLSFSLLCPQEDVSAGVNSSSADLPDDIANKMSLFYANPTPMLNTLSGATEKFIQEVQIHDATSNSESIFVDSENSIPVHAKLSYVLGIFSFSI